MTAIVEAWTPIASIYNIDSPQRVQIAEKDYVVWKTANDKIVVQDDVCPHRLAPLSEGRIEGNELQCGYHGWQFDTRGQCTKVPQLKQKGFHCVLPTYETKQTGDIVWAFLPDHGSLESALILDHDPVLKECDIPFVREVPYSWNYLMENFFDPAHIPFAHHGLQSNREDAGPIPIQLLEMTKTKLTFFFQDVIKGKRRDAKMEFFAPFLYKLQERKDNQWETTLTLLCVPVKEGWSRVFLCEKRTPGRTKADRVASHDYSHAFFNTDDYLVHRQEIMASKGTHQYRMPTTSDYAIKLLQKWMHRYYPQWIYANTVELSKEAALDRWTLHDQFCRDCREKDE